MREVVFFEHTAYAAARLDPDTALIGGTEYHRTPSYVAVRSRTGLLVRFDLDPTLSGVDTAWGFYDYTAPAGRGPTSTTSASTQTGSRG